MNTQLHKALIEGYHNNKRYHIHFISSNGRMLLAKDLQTGRVNYVYMVEDMVLNYDILSKCSNEAQEFFSRWMDILDIKITTWDTGDMYYEFFTNK